MTIAHIAIWVNDLESMRKFYEKNFQAIAGERYTNPSKNFSSYFLSFGTGTRLELMHRPDVAKLLKEGQEAIGLTHFAVSVGSKHRVDALTDQLREAGYTIMGEPRTTGDGYYESVVLDPEGNRIEITV